MQANEAGAQVETVERRRIKRQQVLKRGQLVFGFNGSIIDCLIMNESRYGVQVEVPVMTAMPEHVKLKFVGGASIDALCRWSQGNRIGLEFLGSQIYDETALRRRRTIAVALRNQGVNTAVIMLRDIQYFNNQELQSLAEAAEIAVARLASHLE